MSKGEKKNGSKANSNNNFPRVEKDTKKYDCVHGNLTSNVFLINFII